MLIELCYHLGWAETVDLTQRAVPILSRLLKSMGLSKVRGLLFGVLPVAILGAVQALIMFQTDDPEYKSCKNIAMGCYCLDKSLKSRRSRSIITAVMDFRTSEIKPMQSRRNDAALWHDLLGRWLAC